MAQAKSAALSKKVPQKVARSPKSPPGAQAKASSSAEPSKKGTRAKGVVKTAGVKTAGAKKAVAKKASVKLAKVRPGSQVTASQVDAPSKLAVGSKAPSFDLTDGADKPVRSSALRGKPYVLYFYPKDNTPGCTQEACDFRDQHAAFSKLGVQVLGVSPDSAGSHRGFADKFKLPFSLISDPDKELAAAYGVYALKKNYGREFMGIVRSTFLIDAAGKVRAAWRGVRVPGHVQAVIEESKKVGQL